MVSVQSNGLMWCIVYLGILHCTEKGLCLPFLLLQNIGNIENIGRLSDYRRYQNDICVCSQDEPQMEQLGFPV